MTVVDALGPQVDPAGEMQTRYKPEETPVTLAAKRTYLGRVYLDWAQYPITEVTRVGEHLDVVLGKRQTQCLARERRKAEMPPAEDACCDTAAR